VCVCVCVCVCVRVVVVHDLGTGMREPRVSFTRGLRWSSNMLLLDPLITTWGSMVQACRILDGTAEEVGGVLIKESGVGAGIGRPPGSMPVPAYVLQDFDKKEAEEIRVAIQEGIETIRAVLELGIEKAVSGVRLTSSKAS
jgi:Peptidyl-tRNA hydrolase